MIRDGAEQAEIEDFSASVLSQALHIAETSTSLHYLQSCLGLTFQKKPTIDGKIITNKLQFMDAFSSNCSSDVIKQQEEEDDDWVVVKKQKFTILIPPPSPPSQRIVKEKRPKQSSSQPKLVKTIPIAKKQRRRCSPPNKAVSVYANHKTGKQNLQQPQSSSHAYGIGNIGAVNVVNLRIRAMNLERKLQCLDGMRSWPPFLELGCFAKVFEWKKFSQYQLANLTTSKLKDMGMSSVGPRRKLIHAIDLLCQPYYTRDSIN